MFTAICVLVVLITNTALPVQSVVAVVLLEPMLTAMRVSRLVLLEPMLTAVAMRVLRIVLVEPLVTAGRNRAKHVLLTHTALPTKPFVAVVLLEPMLTARRSRVKANFTKKLRQVTEIVVVIIGLLLSRRKSVMRLRLRTILPYFKTLGPR